MKEITVYENKGIEVFLEIENDSIEFKSEGVFSKLTNPILKKLNFLLENEKPIKVEDNTLIISTWLPPIPSEPFSRALQNEIKTKLLSKHFPQVVSLNISECTLECEECNISEEKRLDTETVKKFIKESQELGAFSLGFAEGEPLLRDDIFELIEYVNKEKSIASVFTPGTLLDERKALKLKKQDVYSIITGIKSPDPQEHDKARGVKGAFDLAVSGMKAALKNDLLVSMHTHATPSLVRSGKLEKIYELAEKIGVHELTIWESHPTWSYIENTGIMLNEKDRDNIKKLYKKANNSKKGPRIFYNHIFESPELFGCMAGTRWLNLIHSGDVTPCTYVPISFGNIKKESLRDIWRKMSTFPDLKIKKNCIMQDKEFRKKYFEEMKTNQLPLYYEELIND